MEAHFKQEYDGRQAHYFIYNSKKLNEVRDFALSYTLEIMIVTIDAINKSNQPFCKRKRSHGQVSKRIYDRVPSYRNTRRAAGIR
jgi:type III restriction enzyme